MSHAHNIARISGKLAKATRSYLATEASRPTLQSAVIRRGALHATNGHVLMTINVSPLEVNLEHKEWSLPSTVLRAPKASETLCVDVSDGRVWVEDKYGSRVASLPDLSVSTHYPQFGRVIPEDAPKWVLGIDPTYLRAIADLAEAVDPDAEYIAIEGIELDQQTRAVRVVARDGRVLGVVMPKLKS